MLLCQQDRDNKRLPRILGAVFIAHLTLMGLLFFVMGRSAISLVVTSCRPLSHQRIVVLPFYKKRAHMGKSSGSMRTATSGKQQKKKEKPKMAAKKTLIEKKVKTAQKQKKSAPKQKPTIKHDTKQNKKSVQEPKKAEPAPVPAAPREATEAAPPVTPDADENTIYMNTQEHEAFLVYEQIQSEVARCWQPPKGVDSGTQCTLKIRIDWQGSVEQCAIEQSSGILMFDVSVRASLKDMAFPRASYGKEITLTFMQEKKL